MRGWCARATLTCSFVQLIRFNLHFSHPDTVVEDPVAPIVVELIIGIAQNTVRIDLRLPDPDPVVKDPIAPLVVELVIVAACIAVGAPGRLF